MTKKTPPKAVKKKTTPPKSRSTSNTTTRETRKPRIVKTKPVVVKTTELPTAVVEQPKVVTLPLITGPRDSVGIPFKIENLHPWNSTTERQWNAAIQDALYGDPIMNSPSALDSPWLKVGIGLLIAAVAGVVWYVVQV